MNPKYKEQQKNCHFCGTIPNTLQQNNELSSMSCARYSGSPTKIQFTSDSACFPMLMRYFCNLHRHARLITQRKTLSLTDQTRHFACTDENFNFFFEHFVSFLLPAIFHSNNQATRVGYHSNFRSLKRYLPKCAKRLKFGISFLTRPFQFSVIWRQSC